MIGLIASSEVWSAMAQGRVDGLLESWGHEDLYETYITKQHTVVDGGPLGAVGHLNPASGFGDWPGATFLIEQLCEGRERAGRNEFHPTGRQPVPA